MMEFRNATYNAFGTINCEIEHPQFGWIPFTADPDDDTEHGPAIFAALQDTALPYVAQPPDLDALAASARDERNVLLSASDWTQMPDAPVDQATWAVYRQALRDVPEQSGFPVSIDWPTPVE